MANFRSINQMKYRIVETEDGYFWPEYEERWFLLPNIWRGIYKEHVNEPDGVIIPKTHEAAVERIEKYDAMRKGVEKYGTQIVKRIHWL